MKLLRNEIHAAWFCIREAVKVGMATSAEDEAFLMQLLGTVAKTDTLGKEKDEELDTEMDFDLNFKELRGVWYTLRAIVENKLHTNKGQESIILSAASKIAEELDKEEDENAIRGI